MLGVYAHHQGIFIYAYDIEVVYVINVLLNWRQRDSWNTIELITWYVSVFFYLENTPIDHIYIK